MIQTSAAYALDCLWVHLIRKMDLVIFDVLSFDMNKARNEITVQEALEED